MWSCDQSFVTLTFQREKLSELHFYKDLTRKIAFFEGWFSFNLNNLGLALGKNLKFCTSVAKELKLKVRKFWGLISTFVEVTGKKLVGGPFCLPSWIGLMFFTYCNALAILILIITNIFNPFWVNALLKFYAFVFLQLI